MWISMSYSWSGGSEGSLRFLSHDITCQLHAVEALSFFLLLNVKQRSCEFQFLYFFGLTLPRIEAEFTVLIADTLSH